MSITISFIPNTVIGKCGRRGGMGEGQKEGGKERGLRVRGRRDKLLGIQLFFTFNFQGDLHI